MNPDAESTLAQFEVSLTPPDDFSFPFTPYSIQKEFMSNLYSALEQKKLGIFESPTGTGKSLSLICGALSWLRDHEQKVRAQLDAALKDLELKKKLIEESAGSDWLTGQVKQAAVESIAIALRLKRERIRRIEKRIEEIRSRSKHKNTPKPPVLPVLGSESFDEPEQPEDFDILLNDEVDELSEECEEEEEEPLDDMPVKIIFCSRTHSQLSQFIGEIQRTVFASDMRVVPLSSRQNCCINKTVKKLRSLALMNEKCLDMLKSSDKKIKDDYGKVSKKSKGSGNCPHLKNTQLLSDAIVSDVMDLEAIVSKGESLSSCPYYATRSAIPDSQVIVVPYNTLLHKSTRESSKLQIKNSIIIIDEAHNLLETVSNIHSSEVNGQQLTYALSQLTQYKVKFEKRFSSVNLLFLSQLIFVLKSIIKFIDTKSTSPTDDSEAKLYTVSDFIFSVGIDNYNLFKLVHFCTKKQGNP